MNAVPARLFRGRLAVPALCLALGWGCASAPPRLDETNGGIRVFGAALAAPGDPPELRGAPATEEPCLKGYDRTFDAAAVSIGYDRRGRIRRISSRNPDTTVFGIRPGDDVGASRAKALAAGFRETASDHRLTSECCGLTLLVDEGGRVFGVTVELLD